MVEVTPEHLLLTTAAGVDGDAATVVSENAWALDRHLSNLQSNVQQINADPALSGQGRAQKKQDLACMVVDGLDMVGDHRAAEDLCDRRDVLRQTKGNRFHLTRTEGVPAAELKDLYREIRAEIRGIIRDTPAERRDLELNAIVSRAIEAKDKNLLGALFDGYTVSPTLALAGPDALDAIQSQLFRTWEPEAYAEVSGLESALTVIRANRGSAGFKAAKIAGIEPAVLGL